MMLYERNKDRKKFFKTVAKAIGQDDEDENVENTETSIGGVPDLDEVLPPSSGHETGKRVPMNTARRAPNRGGNFTFEDLENKLCEIFAEGLSKPVPSPTGSPVGVKGRVPVLGNSTSNVKSSTGQSDRRKEENKYEKARTSKKEQKEQDEEKKDGDILDQIAAEMGMD